MKYITPKYERAVIEAEDILTASSTQEPEYQVEEKGNGQGNVIVNALSLFR